MSTTPAAATSETVTHDALFTRIADGQLLITGNSRLARVVAQRYNRWRIDHGERQWPTGAVFSWQAWLDRLWQQAGIDGLPGAAASVLGGRQVLSLWERVLRADPVGPALLRPESLAAQLDATRRLVMDWRVPMDDPAWRNEATENGPAFQRWNRAFEAICRERQWLPPEDRSAILEAAATDGSLVVVGPVNLLGFDELNPAQRQLLEALAARGCAIRRCVLAPRAPEAALLRCVSERDELRRMAHWVRYWQEREPGCRIGVVVADLQSRRAPVERHLAETLLPGPEPRSAQARPWNTSLGSPLARFPMVEAAFDVLGLLEQRIDIQQAARVLRSPWIEGGDSERRQRALLEKCLRERYPRQLKAREIRYRAAEQLTRGPEGKTLPAEQWEPRPWRSPILAGQLQILQLFEREYSGRRPPSHWAVAIDHMLSNVGWPQLDTTHADQQGDDWQTLQAWREALGELASLNLTTPDLSRPEAVERLRRICREKIFQPRSAPASIQVLGVYEASGLHFDHLWVLGLNNDNWPPAAQPNPFIPGRLQRAANLPHASPERELEVARTVTRRLLESSADCVFSYPAQAEAAEVLPSPLFIGEPFRRIDEVPAWAGPGWIESIGAAPGPEVMLLQPPAPLSGKTARGGHSILKNQALCPFRAFASNRLGAEGLEAPLEGISPALHGELLHRVLEQFWRETQNQAGLTALTEDDLLARVEKHVGQVLEAEPGLRDRQALRAVEGKRLSRLINALLELEKQREPFEVIGFEQQLLQEVRGQPIRLFIDRIDRLAEGQTAVIDYKTGQVDPKKWFGERPEDPQLPLYAVSAAEAPAALVFAVARDEACGYRGVVNAAGLFPGLPPGRGSNSEQLVEAGRDMTRTIRTWRETLERLMAAFLSGQAAVDPKDGERTCRDSYCELHSLCRVDELRQLTGAD